jgi:hypothetical protein
MPSTTSELPDVAAILAQLLQRVVPEHAPLLIAIAERLAAERYRAWAADATGAAQAAGFRACADREEEIARRIESLFPDAAAIQTDLRAKNPDLADINSSLFAGRPLAQQLAIQAQGERLGAATWRALARQAQSEHAREIFNACAGLEEANAELLERGCSS